MKNNQEPHKEYDDIEQAIRFHVHQIHHQHHQNSSQPPLDFKSMYRQAKDVPDAKQSFTLSTLAWSLCIIMVSVGSYYFTQLQQNTYKSTQSYVSTDLKLEETELKWEDDEFEWLLDPDWNPDAS